MAALLMCLILTIGVEPGDLLDSKEQLMLLGLHTDPFKSFGVRCDIVRALADRAPPGTCTPRDACKAGTAAHRMQEGQPGCARKLPATVHGPITPAGKAVSRSTQKAIHLPDGPA